MNVQNVEKSLPVRSVEKPIAWLGEDRLLLDDTTRFGLRRRVFARKGEWVDFLTHLKQAVDMARGADVFHWMFESGGFFFLWIVWKETKNEKL